MAIPTNYATTLPPSNQVRNTRTQEAASKEAVANPTAVEDSPNATQPSQQELEITVSNINDFVQNH